MTLSPGSLPVQQRRCPNHSQHAAEQLPTQMPFGQPQPVIPRLLPFFGDGLPLRQLSSEKIAVYEEHRIKQVSPWTVRNELTILRHLLRLSQRKWKYLDTVPEIELPKAPEGRTRFQRRRDCQVAGCLCAVDESSPFSHHNHRDSHWHAQR